MNHWLFHERKTGRGHKPTAGSFQKTGRNRSDAPSGTGTPETARGKGQVLPVSLQRDSAWPTLGSWVRKTDFYSVKELNFGLRWGANRTERRAGQGCHPGTRDLRLLRVGRGHHWGHQVLASALSTWSSIYNCQRPPYPRC